MYESEEAWRNVDQYFIDSLAKEDDALAAAREASNRASLPPHEVAANQGKLLMLMCQMVGAKHVLEVGTLGGYSTIWLARAVGENGLVATLEVDPTAVGVARQNLARAGLADRVNVVEGAALDSLDELRANADVPFDFVFIDADKTNNLAYLNAALDLVRLGAVIVVDNVVRNGAVADLDSDDDRVVGTRELIEEMSRNPRLSATAVQTVGVKGWDGFACALVVG